MATAKTIKRKSHKNTIPALLSSIGLIIDRIHILKSADNRSVELRLSLRMATPACGES